MSKPSASHTRWLLREMNFDPCSFDAYGKLGNGPPRNEDGSTGSCFISGDESTPKQKTPSKNKKPARAQKKKKETASKDN